MMVNNPLQIYAVVIGSTLYDTLFNVLVGFGLVFVPLIGAFLHSMQPFFEQEAGSAATTALRRAGLNIFIYFAGFIIFAIPFYPLNVQGISYLPMCSVNAEPSTFGNTGTTYDKVFQNLQYQGISLPLGMALVLTATSGMTNALMTALPCQTDVQSMEDTVNTTALTPSLSNQVSRFMSECYLPAKAQLANLPPSTSSYQTLLNNYGGNSDLNWIGSHVLQTYYYNQLMPANPVPGFPAGAYPYSYQNYNQQAGVNAGQWGYPSCEAWWSTPTIGIQSQLIALANQHSPNNPHIDSISLSTQLNNWWQITNNSNGNSDGFGSSISADDIIARGVLESPSNQAGFGGYYAGEYDFNGTSPDNLTAFGLGDNATPFTSQFVAQAGMGISRLENIVKRRELAMEIPIMQAVLLAFLLTVGPLVIVLGGYRPRVVVPYYFLLSSTLFVSFIEAFIKFFENSLHASLSYDSFAFGDSSMLYNVFTFLYQYAPLLFLMVMSLAGMGVGNAVSGALSSSQSGAGGQLTRNIISKSSGGML